MVNYGPCVVDMRRWGVGVSNSIAVWPYMVVDI